MSDEYKLYAQIIGSNLRRIRKAQGLSQQALAKQANISTATISKIENAKDDFMFSTVIVLAYFLNVTIHELIKTPE